MFPHIDINTNPQLSESEAYNIALEDAKSTTDIEEPGNIELVIFPTNGSYGLFMQLAWKVQFKINEYGDTIQYIISDTGEILEKNKGRGNLYPPLPSGDVNHGGNPILNQEDVIALLSSLGNNPGLVNETKGLVDTISNIGYGDYKQIVSESLITAALNMFNGPQNLPYYLGILKNSNFISEETYNQFMLALSNMQQPPTPIGHLVRELLDSMGSLLAELITYNNWLGDAMPAILGFPSPLNPFYFQLHNLYNSMLTETGTAINQITILLITLQNQMPPEGGGGGIGFPSDPDIIFQERIEELIRGET